MTARRWVGVAATVIVVWAGACAQPEETPPVATAGGPVLAPPAGSGLRPVPLPDFSTMADTVQAQMREAHTALQRRIEDPEATPGALSRAYGEMANLLMAARDLETAEPYYLNAQALAPSDRRWAYYLGHLYRNKGPLTEAAANFEHARLLDPDDVATLVWLGEVYLALGRAAQAQPLFGRAITLDAESAAAWYGAGRVALAAREYAGAVEALERALALNPSASAIHYPLGLAFRGLGAVERAHAHLEQPANVEVHPADPLMWALDDLLQSVQAYEARGRDALDAGEWAAAADLFRRALELAPSDPGLRYRLGTALWRMGDARGAQDQFERVEPMSPEYRDAQYSLGRLLDASGRPEEAIERFSAALAQDPNDPQARVGLAGVLGRSGRPDEALAQYTQVLEMDPTRSDAAFGYAMNLVRLERYEAARDRLEASARAFPDQQSVFTHPLARLLAAAPDDRVRDGRRAMMLVEGLLEEQQNFLLGETFAMALAELGQYAEAAAVQRDLIAAADQAGFRDIVDGLAGNLALYERGEPCRMPWTPDELP